MIAPFILNERDAAQAKKTLLRTAEVLSGRGTLDLAKSGFSDEVIQQYRRTVESYQGYLQQALNLYGALKSGTFKQPIANLTEDPGSALILARIQRGLTQAELARELGLKEQQVQRYEAERYRSISLARFQKIARAVGFKLRVEAGNSLSRESQSSPRPTATQLRKVVSHARNHRWPVLKRVAGEDRDSAEASLLRFVSEFRASASPSLLRTGLEEVDLGHDFLLQSWYGRVVEKSRDVITSRVQFDPLNVGWLSELVRLSAHFEGPKLAKDLLDNHGIVLVVEPQIPGLRLDGAAFLTDGTPVIAMTLRYDRLDHFWFTLLHELSHVHLHYFSGLSDGFFDDFELDNGKNYETEANEFAEALLIPPERWRVSPARIANSEDSIERFAHQLGIHPAIVFGRIRKERNDFTRFSGRLGGGEVRRWFLEDYKESER